MEGNEIMKAAVFRSHWEAAQAMPAETRLAFYDAMIRYQFTGEMRDDLPDAIKWLMTAILPVLDKELEGKQGRPECDIPAEEIAAKKEELGSAKAVAEYYGIGERTVYRKLAELPKPPASGSDSGRGDFCQKLPTAKTAKTAKTKEECRKKKEEGEKEESRTKNVECGMKNEEREKEERESASPQAEALPLAAEPPAPPLSFSQASLSGQGKSRASAFKPPAAGEVAALCKEKGYTFNPATFLAYYEATGWRRKSGAKVTNWEAEAELWQAREKKDGQSRASPEYKTWTAPKEPPLTDEERANVAAVMGDIRRLLGKKIIDEEAAV